MPLYRGDMKAGYIGLVAAAVSLLLILFGMVQLTNALFEGHELPRAEQPADTTAPAATPAPAAAPEGAAPAQTGALTP